MSLGVGAYKVGGAGQWPSMRRRYPWQPYKWVHQVPSHLTVQWNTYQPILTWPWTNEGGRVGKKHSQATKLLRQHCEELRASNCIYKLQGVPARAIRPPLAWLRKLLTNIVLGLTLPKLHLATFNHKALI